MPPEPTGSIPWVMPTNPEGLSLESVRRSVELASMPFRDAEDQKDPEALHGRAGGLRKRRTMVALSLLGVTSMALVTLYQAGWQWGSLRPYLPSRRSPNMTLRGREGRTR
jgi:hypothetical protein